MKKINVLNVEENKKYVDKKEYMVKRVDYYGENFDTENPKIRCLRLWLDNEFPFEIINDHMEFLFQNRSSNISLVGNVIEKGIDNDRNYILADFFEYAKEDYSTSDPECKIIPGHRGYLYDNKIFEIVLGKFEVDVYFSTEMINNGDKLYKSFGNIWPTFHDSEFTLLEYSPEKTVLRFRDALPDDYLLDLTIKNIIGENYGDKTLEFFSKDEISSVKFSKKEDLMEVMLFRNNSTITYDKEDIMLEKPHIKKDEYYGYISCKGLEVHFLKSN